MKIKSNRYIPSGKQKWEDLGGHVSRQLLGYDNHIMMVKVRFEKGAVGAAHSHFHSQTTYCADGQFEFTVDGEIIVMKVGDGLYIEPNQVHETVCLEAGMLVDVFSPAREDFLD